MLKRVFCVVFTAILFITMVAVRPGEKAYAAYTEEIIDFDNKESYSVYLNANGDIVLPLHNDCYYTLKGSARDISIYPAKDVMLSLDRFNLDNIDTKKTAFYVQDGSVYIYVKNNSSIHCSGTIFSISPKGKVVFSKDSIYGQDGILTLDGSAAPAGSYIFDGSGKFTSAGTKLVISGPAGGGSSYINCDMEITGGRCDIQNKVAMSSGTSIVTWVNKIFTDLDVSACSSIKDGSGNDLIHHESLSGYPANKMVIQVNNTTLSTNPGLYTDTQGSLIDVWLPGNAEKLFMDDGSGMKCYKQGSDTPCNACKISYQEATGSERIRKSIYAAKDDKVPLLTPSASYTYTYRTEDNGGGTEVTADTIVESDMTLYVMGKEKGPLTLIIYDSVDATTGSSIQLASGKVLKDAGVECPCIYKGRNELILPDDVVAVDNLELCRLDNAVIGESGSIDFTLRNSADVDLFAKIVNATTRFTINAKLEADVELGSDFAMIGTNGKYRGTFDGGKHTVKLNLDKSDANGVGFFAKVADGTRIKDVIIEGTVKGASSVGGLIGEVLDSANDVQISGCVNRAQVTASMSAAGGIAGRGGNSRIDNCANTGKVSSTSQYQDQQNSVGTIAGNTDFYSNLSITNCIDTSKSGITLYSAKQSNDGVFAASNCYSMSDACSGVTVKSQEAFSNGEVAYLLNSNQSETKWYQTCGYGVPSISGETVYPGYSSCESSEYDIYSNRADVRTHKGHMDKGEYSYESGKLLAGCTYCDAELKATVSIPRETLGSTLRGVTVVPDASWSAAGYPEVTIKYATGPAVTFTAQKPSQAGTYYLKAVVGSIEVDITDTYIIEERRVTPVDPDPILPGPVDPDPVNPGPVNPGPSDPGTPSAGGSDGTISTPEDAVQGEDTPKVPQQKDTEVKLPAKITKKATALAEKLGSDIKVVGIVAKVTEAISASKQSGVFVTPAGEVAKNTFVIGKNGKTYLTNNKGKAIKNAVVINNSRMFYCGKSGAVAKSRIVTLADGTRMYAGKNGAIAVNKVVTVKNVKYKADENGKLKKVK